MAAAILKEPRLLGGKVERGAIILSHVDSVVQLFPDLRRFFFLLERKGWHGLAHARTADIKFVEDLSFLEVTARIFPRAILLPLSNADFVDTSTFRPLGDPPEYDVIQIACWRQRKRIELLIQAAAQLPHLSFVQLGSFELGGTTEELEYRDACISLAAQTGARVTFPFGHCGLNHELPWDKHVINQWINKARIGVLTASREGHNRFKMECMAADRPVLIASDAGTTTQKHINERTGCLFQATPEALARAITEMLSRRESFAPRCHVLEHSGHAVSLAKLRNALRQACAQSGETYRFDDIEWDGRNEHYSWGEEAFALVKGKLDGYRAQSACPAGAALGGELVLG
ncbi:MAG TPA: hypothetical protein VJU61_01425 [Polyangiaceae bacterium]|nr:hypothetical protein [Polyangiaceae bacterium]